jgi:hypothetical protein
MLRFLATRGVFLTAVLLTPVVYAEEPDANAKKEAAARFREAERAFKKHDYTTAARAFEEAYGIAPHPAALFNAATAHQKAGNLTRAANLCAQYLRDAPETDARRDKANALISELTPKLGRIEIAASGAKQVQLDNTTPELEITYVDPGDHFVTGKFGDKSVQREVTVVAGSLVRVVLEPPRAQESLEEEAGNEDPFADDAKKDAPVEKQKPLSPTWFYVGVGATVVLGGATIWSGLDTNSARDDFDSNPTRAGLDDGKSKQTRTNVLLGATAVAGVATATIGIFFTNWGAKKQPPAPVDARLDIGPGFVNVRGSFQ